MTYAATQRHLRVAGVFEGSVIVQEIGATIIRPNIILERVDMSHM